MFVRVQKNDNDTVRSPPAPPLAIGLLVEGLMLPAWQHRMLERVVADGLGRLALVVTTQDRSVPAGGVGGGLRAALERRAIDARRAHPDAFAAVDARSLLTDADTLTVEPPDRHGALAATDVARIAARNLDVLLHLGGDPPAGPILEAARLGVWSHWTPEQPEGFWEVAEQRAAIRSGLWRLRAGTAEPLYTSLSSVEPTCVATTRNRAYWKAAAFVPRVLARLVREGPPAPASEPPASAAPARRPGSAVLAGFLARRYWRRKRARVLEKLSREQWLLLHAFGPSARTDYGRFQALVPPADRFWADPHVVARDGRHYVFIEEYPFATHRGFISVLVLHPDGRHDAPVPIIEQPYHMSYPHVFEWRGALYMVTETKENRTIEVYRCTDFPYRWQLETRLMENVAAVDATLLEHGGRWWLFANLIENAGGSSHDELFLFSADSPLSGAWTPHPMNPIVSDVTRARPAGRIFMENGRLYRPSQDCSRRYGYGFNVSEITTLDEARYEERVVTRVRPDFDPAIFATHSLAHEAGLTVIDGQRRLWRRPRR